MSNQAIQFHFDNTYARFSENFLSLTKPGLVQKPEICVFNTALAAVLGIQVDPTDMAGVAQLLSGNEIPDGAKPLAQAYAGHQFGNFTLLGDGRAILLGEHLTPSNARFDIQLKGAGETAYSRRGDGRATLRSMLREYLISEAMYGLGIATSRSLAVVATGEKVYREDIHDGAVLTRIASSHIRVGTFEYVRHFLTREDLDAFTQYTIERHYPALKTAENPALALLQAVMERQTDLIVEWMRVGFIHGVMNTDNMSIAGETFDYGPCAFMNTYHPQTVFSSIDRDRRYAYGNQPLIAQWNLACLANALLPLIHTDPNEAIRIAKELFQPFMSQYEQKWTAMMGKKLGFQQVTDQPALQSLVIDLLNWMQQNQADYTNTFLVLQSDLHNPDDIYALPSFLEWREWWQSMLSDQGIHAEEAIQVMRRKNPAFIPRNHLLEQALDQACNAKNYTLFHQLLEVVQAPYQAHPAFEVFQSPPEGGDGYYRTFCGT